jgi:hypothetical protein
LRHTSVIKRAELLPVTRSGGKQIFHANRGIFLTKNLTYYPSDLGAFRHRFTKPLTVQSVQNIKKTPWIKSCNFEIPFAIKNFGIYSTCQHRPTLVSISRQIIDCVGRDYFICYVCRQAHANTVCEATKIGTRVCTVVWFRLTCEVAGLGSYVLMWKEGKRVISAGSLMVRTLH